MSWKMEVETPKNQWSSNGLRFATKDEAERAVAVIAKATGETL